MVSYFKYIQSFLQIFMKNNPLITFNSKQEMIIKLKSLLSHIKNEEITDFFVKNLTQRF